MSHFVSRRGGTRMLLHWTTVQYASLVRGYWGCRDETPIFRAGTQSSGWMEGALEEDENRDLSLDDSYGDGAVDGGGEAKEDGAWDRGRDEV